MDNLLDQCRGAKFFTKINLKLSNHQAPITPFDVKNTIQIQEVLVQVIGYALQINQSSNHICMNDRLCTQPLDELVWVHYMTSSSSLRHGITPRMCLASFSTLQPVNGPKRVHPLYNEARITNWIPPDQDWIKVNFDGAAKGNPRSTGAGCVARDCKGRIIASCSQRLG